MVGCREQGGSRSGTAVVRVHVGEATRQQQQVAGGVRTSVTRQRRVAIPVDVDEIRLTVTEGQESRVILVGLERSDIRETLAAMPRSHPAKRDGSLSW